MLRPPVFELQYPKEARFLMTLYKSKPKYTIFDLNMLAFRPSYFPTFGYMNLTNKKDK